jgi:hypothetical protein
MSITRYFGGSNPNLHGLESYHILISFATVPTSLHGHNGKACLLLAMIQDEDASCRTTSCEDLWRIRCLCFRDLTTRTEIDSSGCGMSQNADWTANSDTETTVYGMEKRGGWKLSTASFCQKSVLLIAGVFSPAMVLQSSSWPIGVLIGSRALSN